MSLHKKIALAAIVAAGSLLSQAAFAQAYGGVSGGVTRWSIDCEGASSCDKSGSSYKIFGGYNINQNFAVEGAYVDLGKVKATGSDPVFGTVNSDAKASGFELAGVLKAPFTNELSGFAKLGVSSMKAKVNGEGFGLTASDSKTSTNVMGGLGLSYAVTKDVALRGEWESRKVKLPGSDSGTVNNFTVGAQVNF